MKFWKITAITLLCCLADGLARSFIPGWGVDNRAWIFYTLMILSVGDIFYYLLFIIAFELINAQLNPSQSANLSVILSFVLAITCFFLFGSLRFWTLEQKTIMGFAYGSIGILYGYLYANWVTRPSQ